MRNPSQEIFVYLEQGHQSIGEQSACPPGLGPGVGPCAVCPHLAWLPLSRFDRQSLWLLGFLQMSENVLSQDFIPAPVCFLRGSLGVLG